MIRNIELARIRPHPKNPRHDPGSLDELVESIKAQGVMQNLLVVPCDGLKFEVNPEKYEGNYVTVIGNRRREAARLAGLDAVPCSVVILTEKEQVAAMLAENLQRTDLTLAEQGQGFQMMLDLGEDFKSIAAQTGISEKTIKKKVRIISAIGIEQMKKISSRGATLDDYERLLKVNCPKKRGAVLEKIGTRDFDWCLEAALREQEKETDRLNFMYKLSAFSKPATLAETQDDDVRYRWRFSKFDELDTSRLDRCYEGLSGEGKEFLHHYCETQEQVFLCLRQKPGMAAAEADDVRVLKEALKRAEANGGRVPLRLDAVPAAEPAEGYEVRSSPVEGRAAGQAEIYKAVIAREDAKARKDKLLAKFALARDMRMSFAKQFRPSDKTRDQLDVMTLFALLQVTRPGPALLRELFGELGWDRENFEVRDVSTAMLNKTYGKGGGSLRFLAAYGCLEYESPGAATSIDSSGAYVKNHRLLRLYDHLGACGYVMSEEEEQLLGGTHPLYTGAKP